MALERHEVRKPSNAVDVFLKSILYVEIFLVIYVFSEDFYMLCILCGLIALVALAIWVTKSSFRIGGKLISKTLLQHLGDPLKKKTTTKKWCDQSWQLMIHGSMAIFEYYLLQNETWWEKPTTMWNINPSTGTCSLEGNKMEVKVFYVTQLAIWIYTAFSCAYVEEIRKDYVVMMSHHLLTIGLVIGSYSGGQLAIGVAVLFLHDLSDVPLDLLKMINYLKLEGFPGLFMSEIMFVVLLIEWFYFRVFLYPTKLVYSAVFESVQQCPPPSGSQIFPETIPFWALMCAFLVLLWFLHIWWTFLLIRLLIGILTKGAHNAAEDEYEGESSDSEPESLSKED